MWCSRSGVTRAQVGNVGRSSDGMPGVRAGSDISSGIYSDSTSHLREFGELALPEIPLAQTRMRQLEVRVRKRDGSIPYDIEIERARLPARPPLTPRQSLDALTGEQQLTGRKLRVERHHLIQIAWLLQPGEGRGFLDAAGAAPRRFGQRGKLGSCQGKMPLARTEIAAQGDVGANRSHASRAKCRAMPRSSPATRSSSAIALSSSVCPLLASSASRVRASVWPLVRTAASASWRICAESRRPAAPCAASASAIARACDPASLVAFTMASSAWAVSDD